MHPILRKIVYFKEVNYILAKSGVIEDRDRELMLRQQDPYKSLPYERFDRLFPTALNLKE